MFQELELLTELVRAVDTVVLLEDARKPVDELVLRAQLIVEFGRDGRYRLSDPPLTADDPVLAGFPG